MKRHISLLALPLFSIAACMDMGDQDSTDGTSSQAAEAAALAGSPQAAAATGRICETNGSFCVGAPTIAFEDPVVETAGGRIFQVLTSSSGNFVLLAFNADPTRCAAVKNGSDLVEVRACANVPSALWIPRRGPDGQSCIFQNQLKDALGNSVYLSGHDDGSQFHVKTKGANSWFQQFINPGINCP
jgi:hypothetical protein